MGIFIRQFQKPQAGFVDDFERRVIVNCLNEMRNNLIANGKYTDAVDEVLLKIIDAKQKKF